MESMKKQREIDKGKIITGIFFLLCMAVLLWRCFYTINYGDEPYCISSVWRFYMGDALLAEDWFPAQQLIAWILSPLVGLYQLFFQSNEGIILGSRIAYVLLQGIISIIIYHRMRCFGEIRIPAVLMYLLFTQNNMMTLNYNTLGIGGMLLILTLLLTEQKYSSGALIFIGILTAIVVLCQPYAMILFLLWGVTVVISWIIWKKKVLHPLLKIRTFFYVGLGAFFVSLLFVFVILNRADISEISTGLYYLTNDPEHQMDLHYKISKYFERFYRYYKFPILTAGASIVIGCLKDGRLKSILKWQCFIISTLATFQSLIFHGWISDYVPIDFICVPVMFYGISVWFLGQKKNKAFFYGWMLPSIIYTFAVQLTTNTGILAVSSACIVAAVGAVVMIGQTLKDEKEYLSNAFYYIAISLFYIILILNVSLLLYHRINDVWWSDSVNECTERIDKGPAAGIYTSPEDAKEYYESLALVDELHLTAEDQILFLELDPMLYLYANLPVASYSTWTIGENNFLKEYYELHPEKMPTVVYWREAENKERAVSIEYFIEKGYKPLEISSGIALEKLN